MIFAVRRRFCLGAKAYAGFFAVRPGLANRTDMQEFQSAHRVHAENIQRENRGLAWCTGWALIATSKFVGWVVSQSSFAYSKFEV